MADKEKVLVIIDELGEAVQTMREEGETDLRTVLMYVRNAYYAIKELD